MFDLLRGVRAGPGRVEWKALLRRDASRGAEAGRAGLRSRYAAGARPRHDCGEGKTDADAVIATLRIALDTGILDAAAALAKVAVLTGCEAEETAVERTSGATAPAPRRCSRPSPTATTPATAWSGSTT